MLTDSETTPRLTADEARKRLTLTVPEAADVLGISRSSAYTAARAGDIPTLRIGSRLVVPVPKLLQMLGDDGE